MPKRIFFEEAALDYPVGQRVYHWAKLNNVPIEFFKHNVKYKANEKLCLAEQYAEAKTTLAVVVKKGFKFQTCKPSAHYQLPLVTGCPGFCQYCYLLTNLGTKPYLRIYANHDDILEHAKKYMQEREDVTIFEGAATSDPLSVEHISGLLSDTIKFFAETEQGRFKFVTKFTDVEPLLNLNHGKHTFMRFSINAETIIKEYEKATPRLGERLKAAAEIAQAGYRIGFIIAPIFYFQGWQKEYENLIKNTAEHLGFVKELSFELITHRFTARAKNNISLLFPNTTLPLNEEERRFKWGQFGYGKYLYTIEQFEDLKNFFTATIEKYLPGSKIEYFV